MEQIPDRPPLDSPSTVAEYDRARFGETRDFRPAPLSTPESRTGSIFTMLTIGALAIISAFIPFVNFLVTPLLVLFGIYYAWKTLRTPVEPPANP